MIQVRYEQQCNKSAPFAALEHFLAPWNRDVRRIALEYDGLDRLTDEYWWQDSTAVNHLQFSYDPVGNLLGAQDAYSQYTYTYDALDRMVSQDNFGTPGAPDVLLTYSYDAVGNVTAINDNLGVSVLSEYDDRNLLIERKWQGLPGGNDISVAFEHDERGLLAKMSRYADSAGTQLVAESDFEYDALGRLTDLTHSDALNQILVDYDYEYNAAHELVRESHHGYTVDYQYDPFGQLTQADYSNSFVDENYNFDLNGNPEGPEFDLGENNQLDSDGVYNHLYDDEGNLTRKTEIATGETTEFEYDHRNRLTRVTLFSVGGIVLQEVSYTYDVFDRRIARTVDADGEGPQISQTTHFVYDGMHVWADFNESGEVLARYLYSEIVDDILARYRASDGIAWYLTDHLGTVRDIINNAGELLTTIHYNSFGNILDISDPAFVDRYLYTGREFDPLVNLYYYRARWYDPLLGRFLSQDPIGFRGGDANLYRYVYNVPLGFTDPTGLVGVEAAKTHELSYRGIISQWTRGGALFGAICGGLEGGIQGGFGGAAVGAVAGGAIGGVFGAFLGAGAAVFGANALASTIYGSAVVTGGGALGVFFTWEAYANNQGGVAVARGVCTALGLATPAVVKIAMPRLMPPPAGGKPPSVSPGRPPRVPPAQRPIDPPDLPELGPIPLNKIPRGDEPWGFDPTNPFAPQPKPFTPSTEPVPVANLGRYDVLNMGSGGEVPRGARVLHVNNQGRDLPTDVDGGRLIADATNLRGIPDGHFNHVQANHIPGDDTLAAGLIGEGYRVLQPGGTGSFSSSSTPNIKAIMEAVGFTNIKQKLAPRTLYEGRITQPAIEYTGTKPGG